MDGAVLRSEDITHSSGVRALASPDFVEEIALRIFRKGE
jgi:hypothetical protein